MSNSLRVVITKIPKETALQQYQPKASGQTQKLQSNHIGLAFLLKMFSNYSYSNIQKTMILPFSTQMNGKPTYFIERIWEGLLRHHFETDKEYVEFLNQHKAKFGNYWDWFPEEHTRLENTKIHTIREDKNDRWKAGNKIDFFINCRQPDMFRFAPVLPVVSVQKVEIIITENCGLRKRQVWIDDLFLLYHEYGDRVADKGMLQLAQNDGFDTIEDFFAYFNEDFTGKIIHWTDLRY